MAKYSADAAVDRRFKPDVAISNVPYNMACSVLF